MVEIDQVSSQSLPVFFLSPLAIGVTSGRTHEMDSRQLNKQDAR